MKDEKELLKQAMQVIDDYLNAGYKSARKEAHEKAKVLYEEYFGKPYKNREDR